MSAANRRAQGEPKRILVLGATSGIAEACIRRWAARGDSLYLVARNEDRLAAVACDSKVRGAALVGSAVADLDDTALHPELLERAIAALGGLDIAFVAVGSMGEQLESERSFAAADPVLHNNFIVPASLLTWLANYCLGQHSGTLAVLSSVAGDRGRKANYVYGSAKAGLTAFLSGLRNRVDRAGVTVTTIKPGPTRTAMTEGMKGSAKFADVNAVAGSIVKVIDRKMDVVYVPWLFRPIMAIIVHLPERIFKKLNI